MKILHRFCSEEVMTLIQRMDIFPDEFVDSDRWNDFLPNGMYNRRFNLVEKMAIQSAWDKLKNDYYPRRAREEIIKTLMREEGKSPSSLLTIKEITQQSLDILEKQLSEHRVTHTSMINTKAPHYEDLINPSRGQ
jgi:hypothetical protein